MIRYKAKTSFEVICKLPKKFWLQAKKENLEDHLSEQGIKDPQKVLKGIDITLSEILEFEKRSIENLISEAYDPPDHELISVEVDVETVEKDQASQEPETSDKPIFDIKRLNGELCHIRSILNVAMDFLNQAVNKKSITLFYALHQIDAVRTPVSGAIERIGNISKALNKESSKLNAIAA